MSCCPGCRGFVGVSGTPGGNKVASRGSGFAVSVFGPQSGSTGTDCECSDRKLLMQTSGSSWLIRTTSVPGVDPAVVMPMQLIVVLCGIAKKGSACMKGSFFIRVSAVCAVMQASGVMYIV